MWQPTMEGGNYSETRCFSLCGARNDQMIMLVQLKISERYKGLGPWSGQII